MTDEQIVEAMAGVDVAVETGSIIFGVDIGGAPWVKGMSSAANRMGHYIDCDYPNDHNACQRVIDGIEDLEAYWFSLYLVVGANNSLLRATPRQKCGAILKAQGLWNV